MRTRRFFRRAREKWVPLLLSVLSLVFSSSRHLEDVGFPKWLAIVMGSVAAILLVVAMILFLLPRKDQTVDWKWEHRVLQGALGKTRKFILCARHTTSRAQGRVVGCAIVESVCGLCRYTANMSGAVGAEILSETTSTVQAVLELKALATTLHSSLQTVNASVLAQHLNMIGSARDDEISEAATAICHELKLAQTLVRQKAIARFDELVCRPGVSGADVEAVSKEVGWYLAKALYRRLDAAHLTAVDLHDMLKVKWDQDREGTCKEASCTPEFSTPVAAEAAAR